MRMILLICCWVLLIICAGCMSSPGAAETKILAVYTDVEPVLDGKLDDAVWKKANVYETCFSEHYLDGRHGSNLRPVRNGVNDRGFFRLLWTEKFLYVGVEFFDRDVTAEGARDQQVHCNLGDVAEVFLKPADDTYYWELYMTPNARKTAFFYPGPGHHGLPSVLPPQCPLEKMRIAVHCDGSLNHPWDLDRKWTGEMAVPLDEIRAKGIPLAPGIPWKILLARYNFTRYTPREVSAFPKGKYTNFHDSDEYGTLMLVK